MINHETKEIILEDNYEELETLLVVHVGWLWYAAWAVVIGWCVFLVDFA